jgi:hypothetical protein
MVSQQLPKVDTVTALTELGFSKGEIVETIVSTYNSNKQPNAAPMGAIMKNEHQIILILYNSSLTCQNLKANKSGVVNITSNVEIFYRTTFKEANPNGVLPQEWFATATTVNAPKSKLADATIEFIVSDIEKIDTQRTQATCEIKLIQAACSKPKAHSRAFSAAIEAMIHATRVKAFIGDNQKQETLAKLLAKINDCKEIVQKTAPESTCAKIIEDLEKRIESWMAKK